VMDHGDPVSVRRIDEATQPVRPAITFLDGKDVGRVVAPRDVAGELVRGQELDGVDPELLQITQLGDDGVEIAAPIAAFGIEAEAADVQFIDDELVPRWGRVAASP